MKKRPTLIIATLVFSLLIPLFGHLYLGLLYAIVFLIGYLGGWVLWLVTESKTPWKQIKLPYWLTVLAFLFLHKIEENRTEYFEVVSREITGAPVPEVTVGLVISLLIIPIGTWLLAPLFIKQELSLGYYLAWTFFASMGISELTHFIFPLVTSNPYGYFPGMASVFVLAPLAWWGMWRFSSKYSQERKN